MRNVIFKLVTLSYLFFTYSSFPGVSLAPPPTEPDGDLAAQKNIATKSANLFQSNNNKKLGQKTQTDINILTRKFLQTRISEPDIDKKLPFNQVNSPNELSTFKSLVTQLSENLNEEKTTPHQAATASVSTLLSDEAFAKMLQLEEYSHQGTISKGNDTEVNADNYEATGFGACASNETPKWRKHGFDESIPVEHYSALDFRKPDRDECFCCTLSKCIPVNTEMVLDDIFMSNCKRHHTEIKGRNYLVMYHGTTDDTLESFKTEHIKPEGCGELGSGFYVTTDFKYAHGRSEYKVQDKRALQPAKLINSVVMEILVPCGLLAKNYNQEPDQSKAQIERHYDLNIRHKFVIRAGILKELIINKLFFPTN
jgi:hypothetical protein